MNYPRRQRPERFGRPERELPEYRARREVYEEPEPGPIGQRLTVVALAFIVLAFVTVYGLTTVTSRATAQRILMRAVPPVTELDRLLSLHAAELRQQAQATPEKPLTLMSFPIPITLGAAEVTSSSPEQLQTLIEQRAAVQLYDHGAAAFAVPGGRSASETGPLFSAPWTVHKAFGLLNARQHARFSKLATILGATGILLALGFCLQVGSYGRIVGIGAAVLVGALVAAIFTFFAWLIVQFYASGATSPLAAAGWGMIADTSWTMVLTDAVVALTGLALLAVGLIFAALGRRPATAPRAAPEPARFAPRVGRRRPLD